MSTDTMWLLGACGAVFTALLSCAYKEPDFYSGYIADKLFKMIFFGALVMFLSFGIAQLFSESAIKKLEELPEASKAITELWEKWHTGFLIASLFFCVMFLVWCLLEWISKARKVYLKSERSKLEN